MVWHGLGCACDIYSFFMQGIGEEEEEEVPDLTVLDCGISPPFLGSLGHIRQ